MILVDASVWIDYFGGRATAQVERLDTLLDGEQAAIADLTLTEVLQGIREPHEFERTMFRLNKLPLLAIGGRATALSAAQNYRNLRSRGITVRGTIDTLIATYCIANGHALLFRDRDFDPFVAHLGLISAMAG